MEVGLKVLQRGLCLLAAEDGNGGFSHPLSKAHPKHGEKGLSCTKRGSAAQSRGLLAIFYIYIKKFCGSLSR